MDLEEFDDKGYDYEFDEDGRVSKASGHLRLEEGERNLQAQREAGGEFRRDSDDGGHLIGTRFSGSGESENIIAEDSHLNRSGFKTVENHWAEELEDGKDVYVEINPIYQEGTERPHALLIKEDVCDDNEVTTDYYSFTNENLESEEFALPDDVDDMFDDYSDDKPDDLSSLDDIPDSTEE